MFKKSPSASLHSPPLHALHWSVSPFQLPVVVESCWRDQFDHGFPRAPSPPPGFPVTLRWTPPSRFYKWSGTVREDICRWGSLGMLCPQDGLVKEGKATWFTYSSNSWYKAIRVSWDFLRDFKSASTAESFADMFSIQMERDGRERKRIVEPGGGRFVIYTFQLRRRRSKVARKKHPRNRQDQVNQPSSSLKGLNCMKYCMYERDYSR